MYSKMIKEDNRIIAAFAQHVFDTVISVPSVHLWLRLKMRLYQWLYQRLIQYGDPLVRYSIDRYILFFPISHAFPQIRRTLPDYASNIARIAQVIQKKYPELTIIDIGANIGDTAAILRSRVAAPILCVEGDARYAPLLKINSKNIPDLHIEMSYVSDITGYVEGEIEAKQGTAFIVENGNSQQRIAVKSLKAILDEQKGFRASKLLKIDTDGYDCRIIRGITEFLRTVKPVVFFEYDPHHLARLSDDGISVFKHLQDAGYQTLCLYENDGRYLAQIPLENELLIQDLHNFYSRRGGERYCDVCAFHAEDSDLATTLRLIELENV